MIRNFLNIITKHPLGALYGTLLGIIAFSAAVPMAVSGMWDAALVDLAMAGILIYLVMKKFVSVPVRESVFREKCAAWLLLISADILVLLPTHNFSGSLSTAVAVTMLICASVLYFSGIYMAALAIVPALWCCVFMPYHEEIMLLLSFPLRLSATVLSAGILSLSGIDVVHAGTSLVLPGVDIAITDACSGIKQLDAFILIAFIAVHLMQQKSGWRILHFAFIMPAVIAGNSLRIVLTVWLYRWFGETVFENLWHSVLGYVQIIFALLIFFAVGRIFAAAGNKTEDTE